MWNARQMGAINYSVRLSFGQVLLLDLHAMFHPFLTKNGSNILDSLDPNGCTFSYWLWMKGRTKALHHSTSSKDADHGIVWVINRVNQNKFLLRNNP